MTQKTTKGRPTKLTDEIQEVIVNAVRKGNYIETASALAGISKVTLYDWLKRGNEVGRGKYYEFSNAVKKALAESESRELEIIDRSARDGNWTASAWKLERRFPERWGRKDSLKAEVNSQHTETTEVKIEKKLTADPEARDLLKQLYRRQKVIETGE